MKLESIYNIVAEAIKSEVDGAGESGEFGIVAETDSLGIFVTGCFCKEEICVYKGDRYSPAEYEESCSVFIDSIDATSAYGNVSLPLDIERLEKSCSYDYE